MVATVTTFAFEGINVVPVDVQAYIANGLPNFTIVGLADKAVAESRERVRAALASLGLSLPAKRITVNIAPADIVKEGSHYDLPIALAILVFMEVIPQEEVEGFVACGELGLDGSLREVSGVLSGALHAAGLGKGLLCPAANGSEACWGGTLAVLAPQNLLQLVNHFKGTVVLNPPERKLIEENRSFYPDMKDIAGQETARRALEITAAGGHNLLMVGPPGAGKSMLAARLPGLIPPMSAEEMLESSMISSIAGQLREGQISTTRPFRSPHHSCSMAAMVGGGRNAKPGEITLAHRGVLFLDELPEFNRNVLDSLRQPIETGEITVSRANAHVTYPADFQLVAAMNPCRCGYFSEEDRECSKAPRCVEDYQGRLSGPLLDRFDLQIQVPRVEIQELQQKRAAESTETVAKRVFAARKIQEDRYKKHGISTNSQANGEVLYNACGLDDGSREFLNQAVVRLRLSMRGYNRILKVARTIADLNSNDNVGREHLVEALSYRQLER